MFSRAARPAILSALAALLLYAVTLGGTYVYDDLYIVQTDPRIANTSLWQEFWTKDYFNGGADNLYRPLVSLSYAVQTWIHGNGENRAWAFHLVNLLLHAAVCAAIAELARRMTQRTDAALLAGLLFAAHPIHVEAVANIVGRAELMCALGMIVALVLFLRPLTIGRAVAIWGCFVFALLSKEQGLLLPLLLMIAIPMRSIPALLCATPRGAAQRSPGIPSDSAPTLDYFHPSQTDTQRPPTLTLILLFLWTLATYIFFRERILKFWWDRSQLDYTINPMIRSHGIDRLLLPFAMLGRYIALLILPLHQSLDWGGNLIGSKIRFGDPYLYIGLLVAIAWIIAIAIALLRRAWPIVTCLFAAALLWGMISNLPTIIGANFAERLIYIPSAFVFILVATFAVRIPRRLLIPLATAAILLLSIRTVSYAWRWNDRLRLYEYSVTEWPQSVRLRMLLGEELLRRGKLDDALREMKAARELDPDYDKVWLTSAVIARTAGQLDLALQFATRAQQLHPTMGSSTLISDLRDQRPATTKSSRGGGSPATAPENPAERATPRPAPSPATAPPPPP